jgi:hypothetical protein
MPILIKQSHSSILVSQSDFANEAELEAVLAESPALLALPDDAPIEYVARQVDLPDAGLLDLLFVSDTGLPVAVEVKLVRNGESRREIVAQVIDYVSALTQLTVDELDGRVKGALENAIQKLVQKGSGASFEQVWQQCGANLRAGLARVVLVLDDAPPELERIVRFLAERSSLDVRLVVVAKHTEETQGLLYVPQVLVNSTESGTQSSRSSPQQLRPLLAAVVEQYDAVAPEELRTKGRAADYRKIQPLAWPGSLHYEFLERSSQVGAELHLESDRVDFLAQHLCVFDGRKLSSGSVMRWDPKWMRHGRLTVLHTTDTAPAAVAADMRELINETCSLVTEALRTNAVNAATAR